MNDSSFVASRTATVSCDEFVAETASDNADARSASSRELGGRTSVEVLLAAMLRDWPITAAQASSATAREPLTCMSDSASSRCDHDATSALAAAKTSELSVSFRFKATALLDSLDLFATVNGSMKRPC